MNKTIARFAGQVGDSTTVLKAKAIVQFNNIAFGIIALALVWTAPQFVLIPIGLMLLNLILGRFWIRKVRTSDA